MLTFVTYAPFGPAADCTHIAPPLAGDVKETAMNRSPAPQTPTVRTPDALAPPAVAPLERLQAEKQALMALAAEVARLERRLHRDRSYADLHYAA